MSDITWKTRPPLKRPIMVLALEGLFDTGEAATEAVSWIKSRSRSELMAVIDPERFFDFQQVRPVVNFNEDGTRRIDWPDTNVWACHTDGPRDLILVDGIEPHLRWRDYSNQLKQVAREAGAELVITVGALPAVVAHTRELKVTGSAADKELLRATNPAATRPPSGANRRHGCGQPRAPRRRIRSTISIRLMFPTTYRRRQASRHVRAEPQQIQAVTRVETGWESMQQAVSGVGRTSRRSSG
ncbi:MAG: PAC2 family protein [Acidimicrobiales bacterium]